jgi:hypothetical protein
MIISDHYYCYPDKLTMEQLETFFDDLVESHSWSTDLSVKLFNYQPFSLSFLLINPISFYSLLVSRHKLYRFLKKCKEI